MSTLGQKRREVRQRLIEENEFPHIPEDWGVERLRFLFTESKERNGKSPVGDMLSVSEYRGVVPREYENEEQKRTEDELENYRVVRPGQLAVNSMWLNHLGLGVSEHTGHVSPAYNVYDISDRLERRFVHHLMRSNYYLKIYLRYLYGIRPNSFQIKSNDWASIPIIVPDLPTQRAIADFLDRETARIDLLIEKKQRLVALLGERVVSLITQVTMHGMKSEDHADTGIDWWSSAPASWEVYRIASLFRESKEMGKEGLPVLSVSINWGISDRELADEDRDRIVNLIEDKTSYKRVRLGDLVYNMMRAWQGAFGVAKVDGLVSPAYVVARPNRGLHSPYFEHLLRTPSCVEQFRRASKGIADFRQRLYWEHFRQVQLVLPTFDEQVEIAAYIEREQAQIAPTVSKTQESIDRLKEYRSALITAAVTGQIEVSTYAKSGATDRRLDAIQEEMGA